MLIKKTYFKVGVIISIFSILLGILLFTQSYKNLEVFSFKDRIKLSDVSVPIIIDDTDPTRNWSFCETNYDWCSGSGTWNDPYLIEGLYFKHVGYPIESLTIQNSDAVFILRNCILYNCQFGFYIKNASNGIIAYNTFIATEVVEWWSWSKAIDLSTCDNLTINNNFIIGEYSYNSIELTNCINISLIKNMVYNSRSRIGLYSTNYSKIIACNMELWFDESHYNEIRENSLFEASINLEFSTFNNIVNNTIFSQSQLPGIFLRVNCNNNTIFHNNITTGKDGIMVWEYSYSNNLTENIITFDNKNRLTDVGDHGISIIKGLYNIIDANNISYYNFGISLTWSNYSIIKNNILYHTRISITETECSNNFIDENTCIEPPNSFISGYSWFLLIFIFLSSSFMVMLKLRKKKFYFFT